MNGQSPTNPTRHSAIVLLGPTGSGKTPLGDAMAAQGLWGRPCAHFDFGAQLRRRVAEDRPDRVASAEDLAFLRRVLDEGALLEDSQLPLALRILAEFLAQHAADPATRVALNGLPRHRSQAEGVASLLRVTTVVVLDCTPDVVRRRIAGNVGGDRVGRMDDDADAIDRKLAIFRERTAPLVEFYQTAGARIERIAVTATMTPEAALEELHQRSEW